MMKIITIILLSTGLIFSANIQIPISFSTRFTQKITNSKKKVIQYSGTVRLNNGGALKWSYTQPTKKEVCSTGKEFLIVDHDLEQVSFYRLGHALDLVSILKRAKHHKDNLYVATYEKVLYTFSLDKQGRIDQIAYKDSLDNIVNIHFQNMRYRNKPNPKATMQCPYPQSYDLIQG